MTGEVFMYMRIFQMIESVLNKIDRSTLSEIDQRRLDAIDDELEKILD